MSPGATVSERSERKIFGIRRHKKTPEALTSEVVLFRWRSLVEVVTVVHVHFVEGLQVRAEVVKLLL